MKVFTNKKKMRGYREFLYILPFIILVAIFAYYPLYGWAYAFFDYKPPKALSMDDFVGLKWFRYLVDNPVRIKQTLMVLRNIHHSSPKASSQKQYRMPFHQPS